MLSGGILPPDKLFPEIFGDNEAEEGDLPDDEDAATYIFTDDTPVDPQSIEEELRQLAAEAAKGTSTFDTTYSDWI